MFGQRLETAKKIASKVFKRYHGFSPRNEKHRDMSDDDIKRLVGVYKKTKVPCSCPMCGNPRKYFGALTKNEVKQHLKAECECDELGIRYKPKKRKFW